jgi:hypothetical protein
MTRSVEASASPACCFDCGLAYGSEGWADFVLSSKRVWKQIAPQDGEGLLCVTCIVRRCNRLGLGNLSGVFTSGPFAYPNAGGRVPHTLQVTPPRLRKIR